MSLIQKIAAVMLILSLLAGCGRGPASDSSISADDKPSSEAADIDTEELMDRYIIPYEYYSLGQNWNYDDPNYTWPYDPDDIFSRQVTIDSPVEGFALGVVVRELPESSRVKYAYMENDMGVGYNITGALWDAVSRFYFGAPAPEPRDNLHGEDKFEGGLPEYTHENEGLVVSFDDMETLENGDVRVIIDREVKGRPILSCAYTLRPFTVEEVPDELVGVFLPGDVACRFVRVEDIPFEAEAKIVEIKTAEDLQELSRVAGSGDPAYLKTTYLLMNDIDMSGESLEPIGGFTTRSAHDPNSDGFNAAFDGQGYAIRNLKMQVTAEDAQQVYNTGLFAMIGRYGQVNNLRLEDCDVSFDAGGLECGNATGGLAGTSYGAVNNCVVTGKVAGSYQVGGLIGISGWGSVAGGCAVNVSVTGEAEIGVFIGSLHNALIVDCVSEGEVTAVNLPGLYDRPRSIGGFSGFMAMGSVKHCKSSAYVKTKDSADWVGGFMGYNQGEITNCFYDSSKAAGWEAVDVAYQGAVSDVKDISAESAAQPSLVSNNPYLDAPLVFCVVDEAGKPVANVSAVLELGLATENSSPPGIGLAGSGNQQAYTGDDGKLYFTDNAELIPQKGTLILTAYYDSSIRQKIPLDLPAHDREIKVTWTGGVPPSQAPDPELRRITFHIVDENGKPVPHVSGGLEQSNGQAIGYSPLTGGGHDLAASDESGRLYLELEQGWEKRTSSRVYKLLLYGHYDSSLRMEQQVELPNPPSSITVIWTQPLPPKERPPQTDGIRLFMVDANGNPVQGIELGGSPYPKETTGDIPDIGMLLGPSDESGYIRWDGVKPGTYELYGHKDDKSQKYEVKMPEGKTMVDITLTWNP